MDLELFKLLDKEASYKKNKIPKGKGCVSPEAAKMFKDKPLL